MRILLGSAAAAAFAFAATPASAQYGGSPAEQVDGAPAGPDVAPPQDEAMPAEGAIEIDPNEDRDADIVGGEDAGGGKPGVEGEDYALADVDADMDLEADMDVDLEVDTGQPAPPEAYDDAGEEADGSTEDEGPEPEGATSQDEDRRG